MGYVAAAQDPFRAIADPSRRRLLDAMAGGEKTVAELTALVKLRQATVSQHLTVLRLAGLVAARRSGRNRFYRAKPARLIEVVDWLERYSAFWTGRLDALDRHLRKSAK